MQFRLVNRPAQVKRLEFDLSVLPLLFHDSLH